jgi:leucyl aminopeptidase
MEETRLRLQLRHAGTGDLAGMPLKAVAPLEASLAMEGDAVTVDVVAPPQLTTTELRWSVDQITRKATGMFPVTSRTISLADGFSDETALSLALDQHMGSGGTSELLGRDGIAGELSSLRGAIDTYAGWVDEDPVTRTSLAIARDVSAWAEGFDVDVTVLDEVALQREGLRLLLAVGGASSLSPPRLVVARYLPRDSRAPRMLLGKGITFDTGGINVKPYESFVSMMKNDMAGAALAWSCFKALVEGGHDRPLLLVIPTCENPVGEDAMRPGSIVKSYKGPTVRIDHTDAEGRLVLVDGLAWAEAHHQPSEIHCFATLTTSALIAYGPYATPVHFADATLEAKLTQASAAWGEDLHFFPYRIWHRDANCDKEADLKNTGGLPGHARRGAGSRNAGHFLRAFTELPFVHFDIFGSTWNWAGDAPGAGSGATGSPLRTLLAAYESGA